MLATFTRRISAFFQQIGRYDTFQIPLLPLDTVLFPGGRLVVKLVDARYAGLVENCIAADKPIGLALVRAGTKGGGPHETANVGCLARIVSRDSRPDGSLSVQILGRRRIRIEACHGEPDGCSIATATLVSQEPYLMLPKQHAACADTLRLMIQHIGPDHFEMPLHLDDAVWIGYRLAELLPLKPAVRQDMLEMNDSLVRIEILHAFLVQQGLSG